MKTYDIWKKQKEKKEKEIFRHKATALLEFIEFANQGGFWRRLKICYRILFKRIKIVHGKTEQFPKPPGPGVTN